MLLKVGLIGYLFAKKASYNAMELVKQWLLQSCPVYCSVVVTIKTAFPKRHSVFVLVKRTYLKISPTLIK